MSSGGSREGSRVPTPLGGIRGGGGGGGGAEETRGKEALAEFKRFGARIGMASRLFAGRESGGAASQ